MNRILMSAGIGALGIGLALSAGSTPGMAASAALQSTPAGAGSAASAVSSTLPGTVTVADDAGSVLPTAINANDMVLGKKDAPITIIEYASLTCPHCAAFETQTLPQLRKDWIDTGKAKLVFRDYPFDQPGLRAAILARCIGPDKFFGFLDVLYQNQQQWALAADPVVALTRYAKLAGMSDEQVQSCLKDQSVSNIVVGNRVTAQKEYQIDSTPTFLINGRKLEGNQPYAEFEKALTAAGAS